jgi:hypothetical protein
MRFPSRNYGPEATFIGRDVAIVSTIPTQPEDVPHWQTQCCGSNRTHVQERKDNTFSYCSWTRFVSLPFSGALVFPVILNLRIPKVTPSRSYYTQHGDLSFHWFGEEIHEKIRL